MAAWVIALEATLLDSALCLVDAVRLPHDMVYEGHMWGCKIMSGTVIIGSISILTMHGTACRAPWVGGRIILLKQCDIMSTNKKPPIGEVLQAEEIRRADNSRVSKCYMSLSNT